ncbi:MAG: hypothetical protein HYV45_02285 [Candidatus Moranbacteria bacterium]|nr:hypothetical protein [Candidatus Moranbacteria bacterium]
MEKQHEQIIRETIESLLAKMDFLATIEISRKENEEEYECMIRLEKDQNLLIGQHGVNLSAIQHLVRALLRKKIDDKIMIVVDVNDYFFEKRAVIEKEAEKAAAEALQDKISVALRPMLPHERKIVHFFLSKNPNIITESVGKGDERKVMVRPKPELIVQSTE